MSDPLPSIVWDRISEVVQERVRDIGKMDSDRTYLVRGNGDKWVARIEQEPRPRTLRIPVVQSRAQSVGVLVPKLLGHGTEEIEGTSYCWILEEFVEGEIFEAEHLRGVCHPSIHEEFGRQLRLLHSLEVDGFWSLNPNSMSARHSWESWIAMWIDELEEVARRIPSLPIVAIRDVATELMNLYDGPGCLCHGDFKWNNVLVKDGRLSAVIDWEAAVSNDPAHDIGYWYSWHDEVPWLERVLSGYAPEDEVSFVRRVYAHGVLAQAEFVGEVKRSLESVERNIDRFNAALKG